MTPTARYHAWSTAASTLAAVLVAVATESPAFGLLTAPLIALTWLLFRRAARSPLPRWLINAMVIAAALNLARQLLSPAHIVQDTIARLSEFLVILLAVKLLEHRRARDQAQAIGLAGMAAIGAALTSVTLSVAALAALYIVAALNSIVLFQFVRNDALARGSDYLWDPAVARDRTRVPWVAPLRITLLAALPAVALGTLVVFLFMPRDLGKQMLGAWNTSTGAATTGFNEEVQLGFSGIVSESEDVVMEVALWIDGRRTILTEPQYFRGAVCDTYDARTGRWGRSFGDDPSGTRAAPSYLYEEPPSVQEQRIVRQRFSIRNKSSDLLFALLTPVRIDRAAPQLVPSRHDQTIRSSSMRGPVQYEVYSDPAINRAVPDTRAASNTFLAEGPVHDYAAEVLRRRQLERDPDLITDPDDRTRVEVLRQHLASICQYSLELEAPPPGKDFIEWFILERRSGTCEYFASALAAMCLSVGIEARLVTGYLTNEVDESTGTYIVRQRNAHAWVEALVPAPDAPPDAERPLRWMTFDATPMATSSRIMGADRSVLARIRRAIERLESAWLNAVIAFDGTRQSEVLGPGASPEGWLGALSAKLARSRLNWASRLITTATAFAIGFAVVSGALFALRWSIGHLRIGGALRTGAGRSAAHPAAARTADRTMARLDRALRRAGLPRPAWVGALDHARSITPTSPRAAERIARVVRACYAVRFGAADPATLAAAGADIRAAAAHLREDRRAALRAR